MDSPQNIILIGFMGSGKSTVGRVLRRLLGEEWRYIDTDKRLVEVMGKTIPEIFETEGEIAFRDRESQIVLGVTMGQNQVIATGGGVVLREENIAAIRSSGIVVWLTARPEVIVERTGRKPGKRPLIAKAGEDVLAYVLGMLGERGPLYQKAAHIIVDASDRGPEAIAREILRKAERH
jgi:shikimate kinase